MHTRSRRDPYERFLSHTRREGDCLIWTAAILRDSYGLFTDGDRRPRRAHRWHWQHVNGPVPDGLWVLHHCDTPPCVELTHLFLGTAKDNSDDMIAKGRARSAYYPSRRGNPKITAETVAAIRASTEDSRVVAAAHGISRASVYDIRSGRTWR